MVVTFMRNAVVQSSALLFFKLQVAKTARKIHSNFHFSQLIKMSTMFSWELINQSLGSNLANYLTGRHAVSTSDPMAILTMIGTLGFVSPCIVQVEVQFLNASIIIKICSTHSFPLVGQSVYISVYPHIAEQNEIQPNILLKFNTDIRCRCVL